MTVALSRPIAVKLYQKIIQLRLATETVIKQAEMIAQEIAEIETKSYNG